MESQDQNIRRVFEEGFCARDIAQTLRSFDAEMPLERAARVLRESGANVAAVRTDGITTGYILAESLSGQHCGDCQRAFAPAQLVQDALPLAPLVLRLNAHATCFVVACEQACAMIERVDLQKPPGRMWLFGMVTLIETRFARWIDAHCTEAEWKACLSPGRIQKAEALQAVRQSCRQQISLSSCLQFADKTQIIARTESLRRLTRFESKRQIEDVGRNLEKLRNNLAHAQDIVSTDWDTIVTLSENIGAILDGPSGARVDRP